MASDIRSSTALIVFAHPDPWPAVQSLCALRARGELVLVCVHHTVQTAEAADRLRRFCSRRWPELPVVVPGQAGVDLGARFIDRLRDWQRFHPEISRWTLDASGAPLNLLPAVAQLAAQGVIGPVMHRHSEGPWSALVPAGGHLEWGPLTPPIPREIADEVPVNELVPLLSEWDVEVSTRASSAGENLTAAELARLVAAGPAANWDWPAMYVAALGRPCAADEMTFEHVLAAALRALGVTNVRLGLKVTRRESPGCTQTFDLLAHSGGRLWAIDCHLRDEGGAAPVGLDDRILRGLRAHRLVIRPGRQATDTERLLAAGPGVVIVDGDGCRTLFTQLGRVLGRDAPQVLRDVERAALRSQVARLAVFSLATPAQRFSDAMHLDTGVFDLLRGARVDAQGQPMPWTAAHVAPDLWFIDGRVVAGGPPTELRQRLADKIAKGRFETTFVFFELSGNRRFWRALLRVSGDGDAFGKWLRKWHGMPLIV